MYNGESSSFHVGLVGITVPVIRLRHRSRNGPVKNLVGSCAMHGNQVFFFLMAMR